MNERLEHTGWLTRAAFANPLASAGIAVTVLWGGTVGLNAGFLQPHNHPAPIFATRGMAVLPANTVKGDRPTVVTDTPVLPMAALSKDPLVEELQLALAEKQFYAHELDGRMGPKTRSAIFAYQRAAKLEETGEPSGRLLAHIRMSSVRGSALVQTATPREAPSKIKSPDEDLLFRIHTGLKRYGMSELKADGIYGSRSAEAIRTFERQHNLPITGKPNTDILRKLIEIGAL